MLFDDLQDIEWDEEEEKINDLTYDEELGELVTKDNDYRPSDAHSIIDDEDYERQIEGDVIYKGFPKIEELYNEFAKKETKPEGLDKKQNKYYDKGIEAVKKINKKYGTKFNFTEIVNELNKEYENSLKKPSEVAKKMETSLWNKAIALSIKMEETSYDTMSTKKINKNLYKNLKEISGVVRLYAKLYPDKFPMEERQEGTVFKRNGKLRKKFVETGTAKTFFDRNANDINENRENVIRQYQGLKNVDRTKSHILNSINNIITGKEDVPHSNKDKIRKLAECVRLLRPLQARRDKRSVFEYFFNRKVYISERDTLRAGKKAMESLGLAKEEISKVLHGGAFNEVKFNDGQTAKNKLANPEELNGFVEEDLLNKDSIVVTEVLNENFEKEEQSFVQDEKDKSYEKNNSFLK